MRIMVTDIIAIVERVVKASLAILNDVSPWIVISLVVAGLLHSILTPQRFQRHLGCDAGLFPHALCRAWKRGRGTGHHPIVVVGLEWKAVNIRERPVIRP